MNADEVQADQTGESQPVVERRPAAEVEQEYGLPPGSLTNTVFRPNICGEFEFLSEPPEQTYGQSEAEAIRRQMRPPGPFLGECPACKNNWNFATDAEVLAGTTFWCRECRKNVVAVTTMTENPWRKAERLEEELDAANAAYRSLQKDRDLWHIAAKRWISHASKLQNDLQLAKFEAADLKLLLAEAKNIEKAKEFSRNWHFVSLCALVFIVVGTAVAVFFKR